ncbi:MAG: hypothetical protein HY928_04865 [Elusimicrobia bacterium]|nr:hypothetical protein [Elusimicrobiota bacterium]
MRRAALALLLGAPAAAAPVAVELPRKVFVLYRGDAAPGGIPGSQSLSFHTRAEVWFDHLGLVAEYLDASKPLPDPAALDSARAVLTWFADEAAFGDPKPVCRWLSSAMDAGLPWILLGRTGLRTKAAAGFPAIEPDCGDALRKLGVVLDAPRPVDSMSVAVADADQAVVGFERRPDPSELPAVPAVELLPGGTALLTLAFNDGGAPRSVPVALTRRGALALDPFLLYANREVTPMEYRWVVDPLAFFGAALRMKGLPRPDATTLSGRRMVMYRVDGDGFFNRSEISRRQYSGEVFLRQVLEKKPDLPFSLSLISGYYELNLYRAPEALTLSRLVLNRPNVEPGSHGFAHPLVWSSGTLALSIPRYRMDPEREIVASARTLEERFLSPRKRVSVFQWTGDCLPSESDLLLAERAGLLGINGGGGRFDAEFPSYAYLYPMSRVAGSARQLYAPAYNENDFTGLWTGPYYGYRDAIETFRRTGAPRRLKPVDVYVHYYSAEKFAALQAYKQVLAWSESQPLIPVWGGRYARAARDFFKMRVLRTGPRRFMLEGAPELRTVRFDDEPGVPDLAASQGVLGFKREPGSLYVHLDESARREVVLAAEPGPGPWLEEANFEVEGWSRAGEGLRFRKRGWGRAEGTLAGLRPGRGYRVRCAGREWTGRAGSDGRISFSLPDSERWGEARETTVEALR